MRKGPSLLLRWIFAGIVAASSSLFYIVLLPLTLRISYGLLQFFSEASLEGNLLQVGGKTLEFIPACAAVSAYILLGILILLTKGISFPKGIKLFLYGSLLIFLANLVRIELLIYVLVQFGKNYFDTLHLFIWQIVSSVYVALAWVFLTWRFKVKEIPIWSDVQWVWRKFSKK